ncbi:hypothetical protein C8J57DRAFT_1492313 [Mycena rebaudengoi]|nr:hypothetical protein C8J57DRAFT_1492313 [Mycena rebaudengoi]
MYRSFFGPLKRIGANIEKKMFHSCSPTFRRLQQQHAAPEDFAMSPTSATPSADDDAQHLLDNWCNTLSNGLPLDGVGASMGWSGWPGASEASGWVGMAPMLGANPKQQLPVISGDDSNLQHWEALPSSLRVALIFEDLLRFVSGISVMFLD